MNIRLTLAHRVVVAFLAILLPLCAVFYFTYRSNRDHLESLVLATLETLAAEREKNLVFFIEMNKERIRDFSTDGVIRRAMEVSKGSFSSELGDYLLKNKLPLETRMAEIALFSTKGRLVATTSPEPSVTDISGEEFFAASSAGTVSENARAFGGPGLVFAFPVTGMDSGRPAGVIVGFLPASTLNKVMSGLRVPGSDDLLWVNRWESIETYLVNRDGSMITESRFIEGAPFRIKVSTPPVDACVKQAAKFKGIYPDYRGTKVAGASSCLPGYKWTLVAEIDEREAFEDLRTTKLYATGAFIASLVLVSILVVYFMRSVVRPLNTFSSTAARMAGGDYDVSVPFVSNNEIGVLSEAFNSMAQGIKTRSEALALSRARLANAQRIAHLGNWDWDIVGNDLHWSDEIYNIFGISKALFGASYEAFLGSVHPDDRDMVDTAVRDALGLGRPYSIDHRIVLPSGEVRMVHEQAEVIRDSSGNPIAMSGTVQDITERKRAEDEVRKLNAELEDKVRERTVELEAAMKGLEAFSYSVAHDLRTPLRTIDGFSQAFMEDYGQGIAPEGHDYLRRIRDASQRMGLLIDDLLMLSHVTRTEMRREMVDMSLLAVAVAAEQKKNAPYRNADFIIADGMSAKGDPGLLRVVLDNLLGNAFKFTGRKEHAIIEFRPVGKEGSRTIYCIKDNGTGFDMAYYDKLFIPFQRLHAQIEFAGTGIGLATVERILLRHGGRIWAEAYVDKGAAFYFTL